MLMHCILDRKSASSLVHNTMLYFFTIMYNSVPWSMRTCQAAWLVWQELFLRALHLPVALLNKSTDTSWTLQLHLLLLITHFIMVTISKASSEKHLVMVSLLVLLALTHGRSEIWIPHRVYQKVYKGNLGK